MSALRVLPVWVLRKACTQLKFRERCFNGGEPEVLPEHKPDPHKELALLSLPTLGAIN